MTVEEAQKVLPATPRRGRYLDKDGKPSVNWVTLYWVDDGWRTESDYLRRAMVVVVTNLAKVRKEAARVME